MPHGWQVRFSAQVKQELELDDPFSSGSGQDYLLLLQSDDVALLRQWVPKVAQAMQKLPELEEVETMGDEGAQHVTLDIDREAARRLGVDIENISSVLNNSFSQRQISTIYDQTQQFYVVMEVDKHFTEHPEAWQMYAFQTNKGLLYHSVILPHGLMVLPMIGFIDATNMPQWGLVMWLNKAIAMNKRMQLFVVFYPK
jgi:multidrug efflux pump subunit AcrB